METSIKIHAASEKSALTTESLLALPRFLVSTIFPLIHKRNRNLKVVSQEKMLLRLRNTHKDSNCVVALAGTKTG